jgi:drug/metabolite transporter (DMT)-like permease
MPAGYWYVVFGLVSFACMGIVHKMGDRWSASPLHISIIAMITASGLSFVVALGSAGHAATHIPLRIPLIALPFGACAGAGLWSFQSGLRYGRIATSWLLINLSAAVPTVLSICIYHETLSRRKVAILALIVTSLFLLWWDRKQDRARSTAAAAVLVEPAESRD